MLVYEHTGGRTLDSLSDAEITDELLRHTWHQVQALQSRVTELSEELERERESRRERDMIFTAGSEGDVVRIARGSRRAPRKVSQALMLYRPARPEHGGRGTGAPEVSAARGTTRNRSAS